MRQIVAVIVSFLCSRGPASPVDACAAPTASPSESVANAPAAAPPLACSLPQGGRAARSADLETLVGACTEVRELPDGFAFRFPNDPGLAAQALEFVLQERQCCPFFEFQIAFEAGDAPFRLEVRGPDGVKEFVRAGLPEALVPSPKE
jgi:hypothetical protein